MKSCDFEKLKMLCLCINDTFKNHIEMKLLIFGGCQFIPNQYLQQMINIAQKNCEILSEKGVILTTIDGERADIFIEDLKKSIVNLII